MAPLPVEDGSLASLLRTDWVSKALADPCFLHATLFSASAHLDAFQRRSNNHVTTYHYTMALRLLREKLDSPSEAIVFDLDLAIPGVEVPATPLTPPAGLLTAALKRATRQTGYYNLPRRAITILQDISLVCKYSDARYVGATDEGRLYDSTKAKWRDQLQRKIKQGLDVPDKTHPSTPNGVFQSCHAAALLFWYLFDIYFSVDATTLEALVQTLKSALVKASMDTWIRCSPEAHTWICLVGAVATTPYKQLFTKSAADGPVLLPTALRLIPKTLITLVTV
ncbi:predicted protein [Aspergillus terreus NIH2624]|uniref:Uncharacterized protein n=1 Tax=Aspergillus terreus (strain NIH 2624 / FGSC A1156) TaxID=341663 RepID=Q0CCJ2_ASPTN|nr:uncharacterized protein ATEG_08592 [Aspergillus terreus NIH2624]EAU30724.1 predicted protein [Aspergillus terreus NIH2624]